MALKLIEKTLYREPEPPARIRTKPMQVICPGFPRSGTESLQIALLKLGYDYTFHGWDIMFEEPHRMAAWCRLADKKFAGAPDGESNITASDFDALLGHAVAVTDAAASVFAAEMIAAYPTAKVVLNRRRDLDAWHRSAIANIGHTFENWPIWIASWFSGYGYWSLTVWSRYLWLSLFRTKDGNAAQAIRRNGKWIYREHEAMVRGLVPKERLLEWSTEDGWEVLCKFLDKPVPDEPFPNANNMEGFQQRIADWHAMVQRRTIRNMLITLSVLVGSVALVWRYIL